MATLPAKIRNTYNFLLHDLADPRTKNWLLVENPFHVIFLLITYVYFVTKLGPAIMKNREPFQLKSIMIVYNAFQIVVNAFLFFEGIRLAYGPTGIYSLWCQPVDFSTTPFAMYELKCCYVFYSLKILDLLDTVFMVLRKKQGHVSILHLYHHAGMIPLVWASLKYYPGGHGIFLGTINSFVHTVMYGYYLFTIISPPGEQYIRKWKKYLTTLQMVQFFMIGIHGSLPLFQPSCQYPKVAAFILVPQVVFITLLFTDFYIKAYIKIKSKSNLSTTSYSNGSTPRFHENKNKTN